MYMRRDVILGITHLKSNEGSLILRKALDTVQTGYDHLLHAEYGEESLLEGGMSGGFSRSVLIWACLYSISMWDSPTGSTEMPL